MIDSSGMNGMGMDGMDTPKPGWPDWPPANEAAEPGPSFEGAAEPTASETPSTPSTAPSGGLHMELPGEDELRTYSVREESWFKGEGQPQEEGAAQSGAPSEPASEASPEAEKQTLAETKAKIDEIETDLNRLEADSDRREIWPNMMERAAEYRKVIMAQQCVIDAAFSMLEFEEELTEAKSKITDLKTEIETSRCNLIESVRTLRALQSIDPAGIAPKPPGEPIDCKKPSAKPSEVTEGSTVITASDAPSDRPADTPAGDEAPAAPPPVVDDESWRKVPLKSLNLPDSLRQALAENPGHPILTVGDISAWTADGKRLLTDIPRVGDNKAAKIETALEQFWEGWRAGKLRGAK